MKDLLFCSLLLTPFLLSAQDYSVLEIGSGIQPFIGVNSQGIPHVGYFVYPEGALSDSAKVMHAMWDPAIQDFSKQTVIHEWSAPTERGPHQYGNMAFDPHDLPHFTYHRHTAPGDPTHSWFDGSEWFTESIETENHDGFSPDIAIDSEGSIHISFVDAFDSRTPDSPGIEYAHCDGSEWIVEPIGSETHLSHFSGTSIALDPGLPRIAYYDSVARDLMFAVLSREGWDIAPVDTNGDTGRFPSMEFEANLPRIAYLKMISESSGVVRLAKWIGQGWILFDIDTLDNIALGSGGRKAEGMISLDLGETGIIHIAYSDLKVVKVARVEVATADSIDMTVETILDLKGTQRDLGQAASVAVDSLGLSHVAFYEDLGADSVGICYYATRFSEPMEIPCEDVLALRVKCFAGHGLKAGVVVSEGHDGRTVEITINDTEVLSSTVVGVAAKFFTSTQYINPTVELTEPPGCDISATRVCGSSVDEGGWEDDPYWSHEGAAMFTVEETPVATFLSQNYPNPFNPSTTISYSLSEDSQVSLKIYNMLGEEVATLVDDQQSVGYQSVVWDGRDNAGTSVANGIYLYRMQSGDFVETKKLMLLK